MDLDPDMYEPYYTYSNSNYDITAIKINWGWWTQWVQGISPYPLNDGWYGLTADWYVEKDGDYYNYNHNVKMTYGFNH